MKLFLDFCLFVVLFALVLIGNKGGFLHEEEHASQTTVFKQVPHHVLYTMPVAEKVAGFGGPIPMALALDADDKIEEIVILKNSESPTYLNEVLDSGLLERWVGKSVGAAYAQKVDAVSGATLSSSAIIESVHLSLGAYLGEEAQAKSFWDAEKGLKLVTVLMVFAGALFLFFKPRFGKRYRMALMMSSIFILGVWQGSMLSLAKISMWLVNGIPDFWSYGLLLIFLASILIPMLTGRNFYCYYLCPFGLSQELVNRSIQLKVKASFLGLKILASIRIAVMLFCVILLILGMGADIVNFEPFSAFKPEMAPQAALIIFVAALLLSLFVPRPWCRFGCPCGAFLDLFKLDLLGRWKKRKKRCSPKNTASS